jgi:hypothetical protein
MPSLFYLPKVVSLPGSKLTFTLTGTSTPQDVYTDEGLSVAHEVPVEADAAGVFPPIYLDPTLPDYRVLHTTSADALIYQVDDYPSNQNVQQSTRLESTNPFVFFYDTDGTSGSRKYRVRASGAAFEVQASNEAESVFTTILRYESGVLYSNETEVAVTASGSFTGEITGVVGTVTGTVNYRRVNNVVTLYLNAALTGTSDALTLTLEGIPVAIRPVSSRVVPTDLVDDANELLGVAVVDSTGEIEFYLYATNTVTNRVAVTTNTFTNSGTKGLNSGWTLSYTIS